MKRFLFLALLFSVSITAVTNDPQLDYELSHKTTAQDHKELMHKVHAHPF